MDKNTFQDFFDASIAKMKQDEFGKKPIKTLGEVILLLKAQPLTNTIKIDFTDENPSHLDSYRGYYTDLSLDYSSDESLRL